MKKIIIGLILLSILLFGCELPEEQQVEKDVEMAED
jgi:Phr family secreted Rap phosphatase inhibitor